MKKTVPHGVGDLGIVKHFVSIRVRTVAQVALGLARAFPKS